MRYTNETLRALAVPLGGIGTGSIAICGDGGLRQWQIMNQVNHRGLVPDSFLLVRASSSRPPWDTLKILQSEEFLGTPPCEAPLVDDAHIPAQQRRLIERFGGVEQTTVTTNYPFVKVEYGDRALPLDLELEAHSPFAPLDADASGIPAIVLRITAHNPNAFAVHGGVGATLQNAVGWDGLTAISGNRCPLYGGNVNRVQQRADRVEVVLDNPALSRDDPGSGQMVLAALDPRAIAYEQWTDPQHFVDFVRGTSLDAARRRPRFHGSGPTVPQRASSPGESWNAGIVAPFKLDPREHWSVTFIIAWFFPNRVVNWDHFGRQAATAARIGNHYATRFADACSVVEHVQRQLPTSEELARQWSAGFIETTLGEELAEGLAAQAAAIRTPVFFRTEDGRFYGFEGGAGASTLSHGRGVGGSCPLNCTHVFNYAHGLAQMFPALARSMLETELSFVLHPRGYLPHRIVLPLTDPQFEDVIGGPTSPAIDGMLGAILKAYRYVRQSGDLQWLTGVWPSLRRLIAYIIDTWDSDGDGVLTGEQPTTYDVPARGIDPYVGTLWLAALAAASRLSNLLRDEPLARELASRQAAGADAYDTLLWNGEYYSQKLGPADSRADQYEGGCLSDQLFGQWWAHQLDLGYVLPKEHVTTALRSIVRFNLRSGFRDWHHEGRIFADEDDTGLLTCTWPRAARPTEPLPYCDEVWTGIEYQVAAHCIMEGLSEEGNAVLEGLHRRYDGQRRNPYNQVECGDHYVRSLAGWGVLDAMNGLRYDATSTCLRVGLPAGATAFKGPWLLAGAWGRCEMYEDHGRYEYKLICSDGQLAVGEIAVRVAPSSVEVRRNGREIASAPANPPQNFKLSQRIVLEPGDNLSVIAE